jgi:hypothetical protein
MVVSGLREPDRLRPDGKSVLSAYDKLCRRCPKMSKDVPKMSKDVERCRKMAKDIKGVAKVG